MKKENICDDLINRLPERWKAIIVAGCEIETELTEKKKHYVLKLKTKYPVGVVKIDGKWRVFISTEEQNARNKRYAMGNL